ncbi:MAG: carbonic anhydrase [Nitrospiraceae bacterium]
MEKLVEGFKKFQSEVFRAKRELFRRLSQKQEPRALFITCSDSRIDPTLLTQTEPGELFILRNAGNIVPSYGGMLGGSTATIEYGVSVLGVKHVIVCGHTDCGVMKALLHPETVEELPAVKNWMVQAESTRRIVRENYADLKGDELLVATIQENVRVQLSHLRTHPGVAARLRRGSLTIHGWVYSISTGDIWAYDDDKGEFVSLIARPT